MGMPVEFNTMIVTKGNEKRIEENIFLLEKEGYRVYPLDIPMDVRKTKTGEKSGTGEVKSSNGRTAGQALHTDSLRFIRQTEKTKAEGINALGFFDYTRGPPALAIESAWENFLKFSLNSLAKNSAFSLYACLSLHVFSG